MSDGSVDQEEEDKEIVLFLEEHANAASPVWERIPLFRFLRTFTQS
jgi:hypothetical protein